VACAQCHDHKYDPISQKEFYQLYAFFHNVPENGLDGSKGNAAPVLKAPTLQQHEALARIDQEIKELEQNLSQPNQISPDSLKKQVAKLRQDRVDLEKQVPTTMVMQEMAKPRDTYILMRGEYDKKGAKVTAGVPAALSALPGDAPPNRLGLARWLVDG